MLLRSFVGPLISKAIMHSQWKQFNTSNDSGNKHNDVKWRRIPSTRDATIRFCQVKSKRNRLPLKHQKIIIHAVGMHSSFEHQLEKYHNEVEKFPGIIAVGFNFRNVHNSTGIPQSEDDWVDDVIAVVNYFHRKGIPLNNILLQGESLGAAILTLAAAKIYEEERIKARAKGKEEKAHSVKLINLRSFSNFATEVVVSYLQGLSQALSHHYYSVCHYTPPLAPQQRLSLLYRS